VRRAVRYVGSFATRLGALTRSLVSFYVGEFHAVHKFRRGQLVQLTPAISGNVQGGS
jgi:hypothetical protein